MRVQRKPKSSQFDLHRRLEHEQATDHRNRSLPIEFIVEDNQSFCMRVTKELTSDGVLVPKPIDIAEENCSRFASPIDDSVVIQTERH